MFTRGAIAPCMFVLSLTADPALAQKVLAQNRELPGLTERALSPDPDMPRLIEALDSVFIEELTWVEVRDAVRSGKTTAIIATGGVEQNGPYLATGKHNYVLRAVTEVIARKLGDALIAPIVPFVPEGDIDPPTGHMRYPGTISLRADTFKRLLTDVASSLRVHGFRHIILIGDSGGNQDGMREVPEDLSRAWERSGATIHYIAEYYDNPRVAQWLQGQGIHEVDQGLHGNLQYTAQLMVVDPATVRMRQRVAVGKFSINGVTLTPPEGTIALGKRLIENQASVTAEAIRRARSR